MQSSPTAAMHTPLPSWVKGGRAGSRSRSPNGCGTLALSDFQEAGRAPGDGPPRASYGLDDEAGTGTFSAKRPAGRRSCGHSIGLTPHMARRRSNRHSARRIVAPYFPRVPSLETFRRRTQCRLHRRDGSSSETLQRKRRRTQLGGVIIRSASAIQSRRILTVWGATKQATALAAR
jgi:hypothetical protein